MNYYDVLVSTSRKAFLSFTYASPRDIPPYQVVMVPFGNQTLKGLVLNKVAKYDSAKKITAVTEYCLPEQLVKASLKLARLSSISHSDLSRLLLSNVTTEPLVYKQTELPAIQEPPQLTEAQAEVFNKLSRSHKPQLLLGITGSGKTRIYIELANQQINNGNSVLILSPEIGLSQQVFETLRQTLKAPVYPLHSRMTSLQRQKTWQTILNSSTPVVIVGPRSTLFLPTSNIGLIVLDEFHDDSYKQNNQPRYHSLHMASLLAKEHNAQLICGSATPNVTDYYYFEKAGYPIQVLNEKALKDAVKPRILVVDHTKEDKINKLVSSVALEEIKLALNRNNQALVFYNRRGSSRLIQCLNCGWVDECDRCNANLVLHKDRSKAVCHICQKANNPKSVCPNCQNIISYVAPGIKQLADELMNRFPDVDIFRFDSDNLQKESLASMSSSLSSRHRTIILGTQVISKGLDLPLLQTVVIVRAEQSLTTPDYRAEERYFQQITQLIGRVGRGHLNHTSVVIQTYKPDYPVLNYAIEENWLAFYKEELEHRHHLGFPPSKYMANIRIVRKTQKGAIQASEKLSKEIRSLFPDVELMGPAPAIVEKQRNNYIWLIQALSKRRSLLVAIADRVGQTEQVDLDPTQLL